MKKIYLFLCLFLAGYATQAQDTARIKKIREKKVIIIHKGNDSLPNSKDTIEINAPAFEEIEIETTIDSNTQVKKPRRVRPVISSFTANLGFANVRRNDKTGATDLPELNNGRSMGFGIAQNWGFNIIKGKLRLWTGLRYDIHNYQFASAKVRLHPSENTFNYHIDSNANSTLSKVVVNYLGIPIALGFQSNRNHPDRGFNMRIGATGGYRVRTHSKVTTSSGRKDKQFDDFNFNDFALTPFVEIGYNSVCLYARYTMTNLFKDHQGAESNAFEFGLLFQ
jgi:hypothetical protein